jgi:acetyltransferase EpsM
MKRIVFIGAGGHAAELRDYIRHSNKDGSSMFIEVLGYLDDSRANYAHYNYEEPYLGTINGHMVRDDVEYLMAIANLKYRREIIESFLKQGAEFTGFIHPTCQISLSADIHPTTIISHRVSVGPKVKIGAYNLLNSRVTVGHDTVIGDYNFISPLVALSGNTKIGNSNMLGTHSVTIPAIEVGNNNIIGAGTVLYRNVENDYTIVQGSKPRVLKKHS